MVKDAIGLNVAVVGISHSHQLPDEPPGEWISDALAEAGHQVVERIYLADDLHLIRDRFARWVAGSEVDVVIAMCDLRSTCTASALAPLITRPLPGFGDMLQELTIHEPNAALVDAKAALCSSTFVFLLPASFGALRLAVDRLVLPRLDYRAKPTVIAVAPAAAEKPAARATRKSMPPPVPARALARSEVDELFSDPILLVTQKAPARPRRDSSPAIGPMISIPISIAHDDVIAGVSNWAPRPSERRRLPATLIASIVMTASAAAFAFASYVTDEPQQTPTHVAAHEPPPVAAARMAPRSEAPRSERLMTVAPPIAPFATEPAPVLAPSPPQHLVVKPNIERAPEKLPAVESPIAKPAVEPPPAPEKPAAEPAVAQAPAAPPAAVEPAPAVAQSEAPPVASSCDEVSCAVDKYEGACCAKFKPADLAEPKPATQLPDRIDRAMIFDGMAKMKSAIARCDQRYGVKGTVNLRLKVGPDGAVTNVSVVSSPDAALGECVVTAIRTASFAKTEAGGSFSYPFMF